MQAAQVTAPKHVPVKLWRHQDFLLLWGGQSISEIGSNVTQLALPLTAVLVLNASAFQVGLLTAATYASFALIALPAGAIVDRIAKRRMLLVCNALRMIVIGSVPAAAAVGVLTLGQLYVVALLAGACTVFFDVAYQSYIPSLVSKAQLDDANGRLGATQSFAAAVGPGLGGALVGILGAARTMSVDALSYAVSLTSLLLIRNRTDGPATSAGTGRDRHVLSGLRKDIAEGLGFVFRQPMLCRMVACSGTINFWAAASTAVTTIFLVRVLHLHPAVIGLLYALGAVGGLVAGMSAGRLARRFGSARIAWLSLLLFLAFSTLRPLAEPDWRVSLFAVGGIGTTCATVALNVSQLSYRQAITPPALLGRMTGAVRWIVWGTLPLGALAGGALGTAIGVRSTMWCTVVGSAAALVALAPLRSMRDYPAPAVADRGVVQLQ